MLWDGHGVKLACDEQWLTTKCVGLHVGNMHVGWIVTLHVG